MAEPKIKGHVTDFGKSVHVPDFNALALNPGKNSHVYE